MLRYLENILEFEKKFETLVGERGITLSGGQKQRTAIARAIIKEPSIVIFDDSLSAVDTKTEDAILEHLREKLAQKTAIMISHRISTVKNADTIFYLENGSIVEYGTHNELIEGEGRYTDMYRKQLLEQELAQI
jgi:ATP-binding cassette, subfamily B, multidrug efflux pump